MKRLEVREAILGCTRCELHAVGRGPIPFSGPSPAYVAVVGEAPGKQEDERGVPFIGPAGELIRSLLNEADLDPDSLMWLNSVSCFPAGTPTSAHVHACAHNLRSQLELADPAWVILLGGVALSTLRPDLKISRTRGHVLLPDEVRRSGTPRRYFVTFHPAYALRNGHGQRQLGLDLRALGNMLDDPDHWSRWVDDSCVACGASEDEMADHDLLLHYDYMGAPYCEPCYGSVSPEAKHDAKDRKGFERTQSRTGHLFG